MPQYNYTPIGSDANEIRLLTILPGKFKDEVRITLHTTLLTEESVPEYEALSYAWGSTEDQPKITIFDREEGQGSAGSFYTTRIGRKVHGFGLKRKITVTQNLAEAIPYLRYQDEERVMWIDAICVNQRDRVERSEQVQRMADIFSLARRVVVWLGSEGEDSRCAMPLLAEIASHVELDFSTVVVKASSRTGADLGWSDMSQDLPLDQTESTHLCRFLERKWFHRLWIWQEILLSRDGAVLMCGRKMLEWEKFQRAIGCVYIGFTFFGRSLAVQRALAFSVGSVFEIFQEERQTPLGKLIVDTQFRECSDPRDRIFALLSLMRENVIVQPDYTKSVTEVYQHFTTECVRESSNLDVLQFCVMKKPHPVLERPTWVPDFARNDPMKRFDGTANLDRATNDVTFPDAAKLRLLGVRLSSVASVQQFAMTSSSAEDVLPVLRRLAPPSLAAAGSVYIAGGTSFSAFCRLLRDHRVPSMPADRIDSMWDNVHPVMLRALYHHDESSCVPDTVLAQIRGYLDSKAFLQTAGGHVATGPESTKPGDEIVNILGCAVPFLLRHAEDGYQVVGTCHIEGFMYHEGILGSLPDHITSVDLLDKASSEHFSAWRNEVTGELLISDPRWGSLPTGWSVKHHDFEHAFPRFENLDTGEGTDEYVNPFLKWETLRDRGVKLEKFDLV